MSWIFRDNSSRSRNGGFTLIEVAIGLIIIGLLAVPYMQQYQAFKLKVLNDTNTNNLDAVKTALNKYAIRYGHYPRPANPSLATGSLQEGIAVSLASISACTASSTDVCRTTASWGVAPNNTILVGVVPYATIDIPQSSAMDAYKNKLRYVVTESMSADTYAFNNDDGIVQVLDLSDTDVDTNWTQCATDGGVCSFSGTRQVRYGTNTANPGNYKEKTITGGANCTVAVFGDPGGTPKKCWSSKAHAKHYVILTHGEDRVGAFTLQGSQPTPCPTGAPTRDAINCQNTATYRNNEAKIPNGELKRFMYTLNGTSHFDDLLVSVATLDQDSWVQKSGQDNLYSNLPANGNVLISQIPATNSDGTPLIPDARLQVSGGDLKANTIDLNRICIGASATLDCPTTSPVALPTAAADIPAQTFTPLSISGTPDYTHANANGYGISCGSPGTPGALAGIANADEICYSTTAKDLTLGSCPSKQVAHGTDNNGNLICSPN